MRTSIKLILRAGLSFFILLAAPTWAAVTSVTVSPDSKSVTMGTSKTLYVTWSVTGDATSLVLHTSTKGVFRAPNGVILGTKVATLSVTAICITPCLFPEPVKVPSSVIDAAAALGFDSFVYARSFVEGGVASEGSVSLSIGGFPSRIRVTPRTATVTPGMATTILLSWEVTLTSGAMVTVRSREGLFRSLSGMKFSTSVLTRLKKTATGRAVLLETLVVSKSVVATAVAGGLKFFKYERTFTVGGAELTGFVTLEIKGALASVTASPTRRRVSLGRSASVPVRWTAKLLAGASSTGLTISSTGGTFRTPGGMTLGSFGRSLSKPAIGISVLFAESVRVPRDVIYRAHKLGSTRLAVTRTFTDGLSKTEAELILDITGGSAGSFAINRLALQFKDGSRLRVVEKKGPVGVIADISYSGSGLLNANWEIAVPTTTSGTPMFRSLRLIRKYVAGFGQIKLQSPTLPTHATGLYIVRLRINEPALETSAPIIRYFVGARPAELAKSAVPPKTIRVSGPPHLARLEPGTRFAWEAVPGSLAYQIEVYPKAGEAMQAETAQAEGVVALLVTNGGVSGAPVTGLIVPADKTEVTLSQLAGGHLQPRRTYLWRIIAIGKDGAIVGRSAVGEIRTP